MRKLFIITAFVSFMTYLFYILGSDFMNTWHKTHTDDPWNEYASEEDDVRNDYKTSTAWEQLQDKVFFHQTRLDSHHDGSDIDIDVDTDTE